MFNEAMEQKFTFDELNPNYCYHFVLIHHKNRNIVNYSTLGKDYKELLHVMTTELYTLNDVPYSVSKINNTVKTVDEEEFKSLNDLLESLKKINHLNEMSNRVTTEGYVLRLYNDSACTGPFKVLKLQTELYQKIMKVKPNNSNLDQIYLELYQSDKLADIIPYFTIYKNDVMNRINNAMRNMSMEILDVYHKTRQQKSQDIYSSLPSQYKKVLYSLHGIYIDNRKREFEMKEQNRQNSYRSEFQISITKSINAQDVYNFLKTGLTPKELRQLFFERAYLVQSSDFTFLNNCLATKTQTALMFKNDPTIVIDMSDVTETSGNTPNPIGFTSSNGEPGLKSPKSFNMTFAPRGSIPNFAPRSYAPRDGNNGHGSGSTDATQRYAPKAFTPRSPSDAPRTYTPKSATDEASTQTASTYVPRTYTPKSGTDEATTQGASTYVPRTYAPKSGTDEVSTQGASTYVPRTYTPKSADGGSTQTYTPRSADGGAPSTYTPRQYTPRDTGSAPQAYTPRGNGPNTTYTPRFNNAGSNSGSAYRPPGAR
jgi:hypothetical protein